MEKPPATTTNRKRKRTEQIADMARLHFDHGMGYKQVADKYGITVNTCRAAVYNYMKKN